MRLLQARKVFITSGTSVVAALFLLILLITFCYISVPTHNTDTQHFDAILLLGTPTRPDGEISPEGQWLVDEAVREYQARRAEHVIISGSAVANSFVEADALSRHAEEQGIPNADIFEDRAARNTLENITNAAAIMNAHGWKSVEVIGLKEHLPRTGVLLQHTFLLWRTHAAIAPGRDWADEARHTAEEAFGTTILRVFGLRSATVLHRIKLLFLRATCTERHLLLHQCKDAGPILE